MQRRDQPRRDTAIPSAGAELLLAVVISQDKKEV
jgi:hypothetical protein